MLLIPYYSFALSFPELVFRYLFVCLFVSGRVNKERLLKCLPTPFASSCVSHNPLSLWKFSTLLRAKIIAFIFYPSHDISLGVLSIAQIIKDS